MATVRTGFLLDCWAWSEEGHWLFEGWTTTSTRLRRRLRGSFQESAIMLGCIRIVVAVMTKMVGITAFKQCLRSRIQLSVIVLKADWASSKTDPSCRNILSNRRIYLQCILLGQHRYGTHLGRNRWQGPEQYKIGKGWNSVKVEINVINVNKHDFRQ